MPDVGEESSLYANEKRYALDQFKRLLDEYYPTAQDMFLAAFTSGFDLAKSQAAVIDSAQRKLDLQRAIGDYEALAHLDEKLSQFIKVAHARRRKAKVALYGPYQGHGSSETFVSSGSSRGYVSGGYGSGASGKVRTGGVMSADGSTRYSDGTVLNSDGSVRYAGHGE